MGPREERTWQEARSRPDSATLTQPGKLQAGSPGDPRGQEGVGGGGESLPGLRGSFSRKPLGINPSPTPFSRASANLRDAIWGVSAAGRVTELGPLSRLDPSASLPGNTPTQETIADRPRPTVLLSGSGSGSVVRLGEEGVGPKALRTLTCRKGGEATGRCPGEQGKMAFRPQGVLPPCAPTGSLFLGKSGGPYSGGFPGDSHSPPAHALSLLVFGLRTWGAAPQRVGDCPPPAELCSHYLQWQPQQYPQY